MAVIVPIKIQCGCGQKYAFDVEPIGGRMPGAVACPKCGIDGTSAANAVLSQQYRDQGQAAVSVPSATPAVARMSIPATPPPGMRVTAPAAPTHQTPAAMPQPNGSSSSVRVGGLAAAAATAPSHAPAPTERKRLAGQLEPERAASEARAKIMWGDDVTTVTNYLQSQGFSIDEAKSTIAPMLVDRAAAVRKAGVGRMVTGSLMILVGVVGVVLFLMGYMPDKLMGAGVCIGAWGGWKFISGLIMFLSPKSEKGDVADM